jgi:hypothetical protein
MLGSRERGGVVARGAGELPVASLVVTTVNSEQRRDVQRAGCDAASSKQRTGHDAASERAGMLSMGSRWGGRGSQGSSEFRASSDGDWGGATGASEITVCCMELRASWRARHRVVRQRVAAADNRTRRGKSEGREERARQGEGARARRADFYSHSRASEREPGRRNDAVVFDLHWWQSMSGEEMNS